MNLDKLDKIIEIENGKNKETFYSVTVDAPLSDPLTYASQKDAPPLPPGQPVIVPLGNRKANGVILHALPSFDINTTSFKIKSILEVRDLPALSPVTLNWIQWLAKYYFYPLGQISALCFPPLKKGGVKTKKKSPTEKNLAPSAEKKMDLTTEQMQVIEAIGNNTEKFKTHLIHGVTGSGKTEIYLQLLEQVIKQNKKGLILVPEISLTPQLLRRFLSRFPRKVAVLHSHLTKRERTNQWWSMINGEKDILLGARSALFCPIEHLGMIVVDEEHEPSFKQEEQLKYHARDAAIMLAQLHQCPIVLGSATPSLESWQNALSGKYQIHTLSKRVAERPMPQMEVVDMKNERKKRRDRSSFSLTAASRDLPFWMSDRLHDALRLHFSQGHQAVLFLNRRGIAQTVFCSSCGLTYECPNCSISLTLHHFHHLVCHYCEYTEKLPENCKECRSPDVGPIGLGTELIEIDVRRLFPSIRIARADRDEIQNRHDLEELILKFERRETDLLIGTQMIAKGLDFEGLHLVGLVMADVGFHLPDFRAAERSFQLLVQVSGRAGRHSESPGEVIIQTYNPQHPSIVHAIKNQYKEFADQELKTRQLLHYPPFGRILIFRFLGTHENKTETAAIKLGQRCQFLKTKKNEYSRLYILGPAPSPISKLRGKYRFQLLIKSPEVSLLLAFCRQVLSDGRWIPSGIKIQIDMDPVSLI